MTKFTIRPNVGKVVHTYEQERRPKITKHDTSNQLGYQFDYKDAWYSCKHHTLSME